MTQRQLFLGGYVLFPGGHFAGAWRHPYSTRDWLGREALSPSVHLVLGFVLPALVLAWNLRRVWVYTVDDAYISFRYARNLVEGLGLVYNPGERIEGYTNFLWTLMAAAGMSVGLDPAVLVKWLGKERLGG